MVQHRPAYYLSVHMSSTRVLNADWPCCGGEGRLCHHLADGATVIMRDGDEYRDVYPVWNWRQIPAPRWCRTALILLPMPCIPRRTCLRRRCFRWHSWLCGDGFLACRPYGEKSVVLLRRGHGGAGRRHHRRRGGARTHHAQPVSLARTGAAERRGYPACGRCIPAGGGHGLLAGRRQLSPTRWCGHAAAGCASRRMERLRSRVAGTTHPERHERRPGAWQQASRCHLCICGIAGRRGDGSLRGQSRAFRHSPQ